MQEAMQQGQAPMTLAERAVEVLTTADGREKCAVSRRHAEAWFASRAAGAPGSDSGINYGVHRCARLGLLALRGVLTRLQGLLW